MSQRSARPATARALSFCLEAPPYMPDVRFPVRERIASRLNELARMLDAPTPANIAAVRAELQRLGAAA